MGDLNTQLKKSTITLLLVGITLLALGTAAILYTIEGPGNYGWHGQKPATTVEIKTNQAQKTDGTAVTFTGVAGKNVLEQLQAVADVEMKDSSIGPYVDSIDGVKGGTDGKYWVYYVDGKMATVGAQEYVTKGGEQVSWKFE